MAGGNSYNGWPANSDPNAIGIDKNWGAKVGAPAFGSGGYAGGMKSGDVSTLFVYLVNRLHNEVEPMMKEGNSLGYGCWGYSYRDNVNNPGSLSCHASGTAIDYNAPKHPNGTSTGPSGGGGWSGSQYNAIKAILNGPLQGSISWLTSNDPMHFEIKGSASFIASVAKSLGGSTGGGGQPQPQPEDEDDMKYQLVKANSGNGAIFAYCPGRFFHVPSQTHLTIGDAAGIWTSTSVRVVSKGDLDVLRDNCCGNSTTEGANSKGVNIITGLPSNIAT